MKVLAITGTPGVGKSTLARFLAKKFKFNHLDLHQYYSDLASGYNKRKQCYDLDLNKVEKLIRSKITELKAKKIPGMVIDSHIVHLLPAKLFDLCVVLTCPNLKLLQRRLKKRHYSKAKIKENLEAEIFQVCLMEAKQKRQNILVLNVSSRIKSESSTKIIRRVLKLI